MKQRPIGTTSINASVIALGTWGIGGSYFEGVDKKEALSMIEKALDLGINLIDTAPAYGYGLAEELVGEAIQSRRDQVILSTKCGLGWTKDPSAPSGYSYSINLHKECIKRELEDSLRRLKTDYIDIYFTHWQDPNIPLSETTDLLLKFKKEGKIRAIGASNVSFEQLKEYKKLEAVDVIQEEYSLLNRRLKKDFLPFCKKHQISMFAYCPLAQGLLTGKILPGHTFSQKDLRRMMKCFSDEKLREVQRLNEQLIEISESYQISLTQLILAWTLQQRGLSHVLCGVRHEKYLSEDVQAAALDISETDLGKITSFAEHSKAVFKMLV